MLLNHFNLREQPFGVTPDPRYFFPSKTHREALAGLLYGIDSGLGFIALTAEPGMGKTTLLHMALDRLGNTAKTVFLFQVITDPAELFRALLIELGEPHLPGTLIELEMRLNEILLKHTENGSRLVIVIDEAQKLDDSILETIRMLSNFETSRQKLLQVILCGQQGLAERLATPALLQLRQRISIFATLTPLTPLETADYIQHRLNVAGYENSTPLFTPEALSLVAGYGSGIPRTINNICFNALSFGAASGNKVIDAKLIHEAIIGLGLERSTLAESSDHLDRHEPRFSEANDHQDVPQPRFAESSDHLHVPEARFAESSIDYERNDYGFDDSAFSDHRETSSGMRIAVIAALLVAAALVIIGWNVSGSGGHLLPPISQITSWLQSTPPEKNQPQPQASTSPQAPAPSQDDQSAPTPISPPEISTPQVPASSQDDSSLQSAPPPETKPAHEATAKAPPAPQISKPDREKPEPKPRVSRTTIPNGAEVIGARQGQSFAGICVQRFNGCTTALLNTIIELNPDIKDHDHLKAGQRVVLPSLPRQTH